MLDYVVIILYMGCFMGVVPVLWFPATDRPHVSILADSNRHRCRFISDHGVSRHFLKSNHGPHTDDLKSKNRISAPETIEIGRLAKIRNAS